MNKYVTPELELVKLCAQNVIMNSNGGGEGGNNSNGDKYETPIT